MNDNKSAFRSTEYDRKIKQTLPYYDEFYKQVIELVKIFNPNALRWLDIGCGTGKMGSIVFENFELERFVFCDSSDEMINIAKRSLKHHNAEFSVCDIKKMSYANEFNVITAIQVNHYLHIDERKTVLEKCYKALENNGLFISFENFAPFTDLGKKVYLEKWKRYQMEQGKSALECENHVKRYGKDYFPISISENMKLMKNCGFKVVEILWLSNMQVGLWGMK